MLTDATLLAPSVAPVTLRATRFTPRSQAVRSLTASRAVPGADLSP
jgi:hypothetical protein